MTFDKFLSSRGATAIILILIFVVSYIPVAYGQVPTGADLRVIRLDDHHNPPNARGSLLVQVQDVTSGPIAGAEVTFTAPKEAGDFAGGRRQVTVFTDPRGIAIAEGFQLFKPNAPTEILVNARYRTLSVSRTLLYNETHNSTKGWKWLALAGVAGAAVVGVVLATRKESQPSSGVPVGVQVGAPTLSRP